MARAKYDGHLQVFRGSRLPLGVYAKHANIGCCGSVVGVAHDRLADIVHGPNSHAHLKPCGFNDKYMFPIGPVGGALERDKDDIVAYINEVGVGAKIGVLCIPNFARVTDIGVRIEAEEPGVTFNLVTRNGLALPQADIKVITTAANVDAPCELVRNAAAGNAASFTNFGAMGDNAFIDIFGSDGLGTFALEADEIMLEVASMPTNKRVNGTFRLVVAVNYRVCDRAERE
ncbi:MAG: hypothetical protein NC080_07410 [Paraprevotella sp.]|nr:hypothetical protein [Paraprevotella sp.]